MKMKKKKKEMSINYPMTQWLADFLNSACNEAASLKFEAENQMIHARDTEALAEENRKSYSILPLVLNGLFECVYMCDCVYLWMCFVTGCVKTVWSSRKHKLSVVTASTWQ